ncbi:MAG: hypothetical protein JWR76_1362, partial [Mucilaginibacter sp.]|nr:hypothetical protein [Mucilaginibacter sp.]
IQNAKLIKFITRDIYYLELLSIAVLDQKLRIKLQNDCRFTHQNLFFTY